MILAPYPLEFLHRNISKRACKIGLIHLGWLFSIFAMCPFAFAIEIGFDEGRIRGNVVIDRAYTKGDGFTKKQDTLRGLLELEGVWEIGKYRLFQGEPSWQEFAKIKLVDSETVEHNLTMGKTHSEVRKRYGALRFKEVYLGIGKQPIVWGVARGVNPTNYLLNLELFEKHIAPEFPLEGINSVLIESSVQEVTIESVFTDLEPFRNATRFKTFAWDTDLSLSFLIDEEGKNRIGGDFERDFYGLFGLYSEIAIGSLENNYQVVTGVSKALPYFNRSIVDFEYLKGESPVEKLSAYTARLSLLAKEDFSLLTLVSLDDVRHITRSMIRMGYSWGKTEFTILALYNVDNNKSDYNVVPFKYLIFPMVIRYF